MTKKIIHSLLRPKLLNCCMQISTATSSTAIDFRRPSECGRLVPTVAVSRQPHRPRHSVVASLDDHLRPPANARHPPEEAVGVDQLVAVHCIEGLTHTWPDPGSGVILNVCEWDLQFRGEKKGGGVGWMRSVGQYFSLKRFYSQNAAKKKENTASWPPLTFWYIKRRSKSSSQAF